MLCLPVKYLKLFYIIILCCFGVFTLADVSFTKKESVFIALYGSKIFLFLLSCSQPPARDVTEEILEVSMDFLSLHHDQMDVAASCLSIINKLSSEEVLKYVAQRTGGLIYICKALGSTKVSNGYNKCMTFIYIPFLRLLYHNHMHLFFNRSFAFC